MASVKLNTLLDTLLEELGVNSEPGDVSDDDIQKLLHFFPEKLLLAAFDLVDRERVMHLKTTWGRSFYEVHGLTSTYTVQPDLPPRMPAYCSCPAFAFSVLLAEEHLMCKHVLAVKLAQRLNKCVERNISEEGLMATALVQYE
ncbi:hypothetical protein M0805_005817 [Coniferiporia weirii]|nr:hypothetical protein M0805_005817 [Coniferiporia weirii]